jgi:hypothetical protein
MQAGGKPVASLLDKSLFDKTLGDMGDRPQ